MTDKVTLLIVDDSDDDLESCSEFLSDDFEREWVITGINDSREGLELTRQHHFDCVLLDYSLPGLNGIEVLKRLREDNTEVPVVMLTGQGSERLAVEAMKAGAQDYIPKSEMAFPRISNIVIAAIEQKQQELELLQRANFDHLTGLAGRALFLDRLNSAVIRSDRHESPFSLLFIDLDKFKAVNDTLGHKFGDLLLKEVAKRLRTCMREGDTVARLGGDEFVILFEDLPGDGMETTKKMMKRAYEQITSTPYRLAEETVEVGASIGATVYPTITGVKEALLDNADRAMYAAKRDPDTCLKMAESEAQ